MKTDLKLVERWGTRSVGLEILYLLMCPTTDTSAFLLRTRMRNYKYSESSRKVVHFATIRHQEFKARKGEVFLEFLNLDERLKRDQLEA